MDNQSAPVDPVCAHVVRATIGRKTAAGMIEKKCFDMSGLGNSHLRRQASLISFFKDIPYSQGARQRFTETVTFRLHGSLIPSGSRASLINCTFTAAGGIPRPTRMSRTLVARSAAVETFSTITVPLERR